MAMGINFNGIEGIFSNIYEYISKRIDYEITVKKIYCQEFIRVI